MVEFSPDGKTALSGSGARWLEFSDNAARLWSLHKIEKHSKPVNSVAFSPDGKTALSGSGALARAGDNTVRLWELATGREIPQARGAFARGRFGCLCAGRQDRAVGE